MLPLALFKVDKNEASTFGATKIHFNYYKMAAQFLNFTSFYKQRTLPLSNHTVVFTRPFTDFFRPVSKIC